MLVVVVGFLRVVGAVGGGDGDGDGDGDEVAATTTTTVKPTTTTTALPAAPSCTIGEVSAGRDPAKNWARIIVDTRRRLPDAYVPPDLVDASAAGFPTGFKLRSLVIDDLRALREAAKANGTPIGLIAAFRTAAQQADLYARREKQLGAEATHRAARGGHSEHQLGTAIDVGDEGDFDVFQDWGASAAGKWMAAHAHEYGFVLSYPQGKTAATCYDYEPWHFRYLGRARARAVQTSGLTLREFLWAEAKGATPTATSAG